MTITVSADTNKRRETFFRLAFGDNSGYIAVASLKEKSMNEQFFYYPEQLDELLEFINRHYVDNNLYFCPQLLSTKKRTKEYVDVCPSIWSDLDDCPPEKVLVPPSIVTETSPGRYQALWILDRPLDPDTAEDVSRRIAYYHAEDGADKSGWDLTQLLRIPLTYNYKYEDEIVRVREANDKRYRLTDFDAYPQAEGFEYLEIPFPETLPDTLATDILEAHKTTMNPGIWTLFHTVPTSDWSKSLWNLEMMLFESGLDRESVYLIAEASACNKYKRDNRRREQLWKEVCKAEAHLSTREKDMFFVPEASTLPTLLSDKEKEWVQDNPSIIEDYVNWAKTLGDAAWQYHQAGAFTILSSLLSSTVRLPTSYGLMKPNLWFLILADTTLTRKTTAMDLAMDQILEVDPDCVLATDGSIEGLMTGISTRPGRASIFLRDEFSGLLEMMTKRDYYAGMAETLTKLYDGKFQKRILRKEIIEVRDPILIVFAGGIRTRIYELLNYSHISSGFVPRFIFISAESDITRLRPLGPPTDAHLTKRTELLSRFNILYDYYRTSEVNKVNGKEVTTKRYWDAELTPEAWSRYNRYEADMLSIGLESDRPDLLTPVMDRLAKSGLKMAVLLAATRMDTKVFVTEQDLTRSFYYIDQWAKYSLDLLMNVGKTTNERTLERILGTIDRQSGVTRSQVMQNHHLTARDMELIIQTLEQRGNIRRHKKGRGEYYERTK